MSTLNLHTVAEIEISYKNPSDLLQRPRVTTSKEMVRIIRDYSFFDSGRL